MSRLRIHRHPLSGFIVTALSGFIVTPLSGFIVTPLAGQVD